MSNTIGFAKKWLKDYSVETKKIPRGLAAGVLAASHNRSRCASSSQVRMAWKINVAGPRVNGITPGKSKSDSYVNQTAPDFGNWWPLSKTTQSILMLHMYYVLFNYFNSKESTKRLEPCCSSLMQLKALVLIKFIWKSIVLDPFLETERTLKTWLTHSLNWQRLTCWQHWQWCQPQSVTGTPVLLKTTHQWLENSYYSNDSFWLSTSS